MHTFDESADDVAFGFADDHLVDLMEKLDEAGVDTAALLSEMASLDPDRLMRSHRAVTYLHDKNVAAAEREKQRIDDLTARKNAPLERRAQYLGEILVQAARVLAERTGGKVKKLDTLTGYVQLRKPTPSLVVDDEEATVAWLKTAGFPDYVRVKESVDKAQMKRDWEGFTGMPGVRLETPPEDSATIKHIWGEKP